MFKKIVSWLSGAKPNPKFEHPLDAVTTPKLPAVQIETTITAQPEKKPRKPRVPAITIKSPAIAAWPFPIEKPVEGKPTSTVTLEELEALQVAPIKKERKKRTFAPKPKA
jgi:hypothetical protein